MTSYIDFVPRKLAGSVVRDSVGPGARKRLVEERNWARSTLKASAPNGNMAEPVAELGEVKEEHGGSLGLFLYIVLCGAKMGLR